MTRSGQHLDFHTTTVAIAALAVVAGAIPDEAFGRPSGGRAAATSVHRGAAGGGGAHARPASRSNVTAGGAHNQAQANRGGTRVSNSNVNINSNRNVNVDVDGGWDNNGWDHHPVARGVAFGTAAAVTSAVVGSMIYSLPPSCRTVVYVDVTYSQCGDIWYQPQYAGSSVTYVVVSQPY